MPAQNFRSNNYFAEYINAFIKTKCIIKSNRLIISGLIYISFLNLNSASLLYKNRIISLRG